METFKVIGIGLATNGTLLALFIIIFKKCFDAWLSKSTEIHLKKIELENNKNLYSYGKIFDEQAAIIKEIYSDITVIFGNIQHLLYHFNLLENNPELFDHLRIPKNGDGPKWDKYLKATLSESREEKIAKKTSELASTTTRKIQSNKIFFPKHIANELEVLSTLGFFIASQFKNVTYRDPETFETPIANEVIETWKQAIETSRTTLPILEDMFRKHLRIEETEKNDV